MDALRDAARLRVAAVFEWLVAALFLCATIAVGSMILHELRTPARPVSTAARPSTPQVSASVPAGAVSVPALPLADGKELRIGATLSSVATLLGRAAETGRQDIAPGSHGERLSRFYEHAGTRFMLVFEPFERHGEPRLAAIYLTR